MVEILSPGDETHEKLDWYASRRVGQVLILDPATRRPELFVLERLVLVEAAPLRIPVLGLDITVVEEPQLRLSWDGGETLI